MIRSRINYASFLYGNSAATHLSKLDKLPNACLRVIEGFTKSTPLHVMESELTLPRLSVRRQYLAGKMWLKSKSFSTNILVAFKTDLTNSFEDPYCRHKKRSKKRRWRSNTITSKTSRYIQATSWKCFHSIPGLLI